MGSDVNTYFRFLPSGSPLLTEKEFTTRRRRDFFYDFLVNRNAWGVSFHPHHEKQRGIGDRVLSVELSTNLIEVKHLGELIECFISHVDGHLFHRLDISTR